MLKKKRQVGCRASFADHVDQGTLPRFGDTSALEQFHERTVGHGFIPGARATGWIADQTASTIDIRVQRICKTSRICPSVRVLNNLTCSARHDSAGRVHSNQQSIER